MPIALPGIWNALRIPEVRNSNISAAIHRLAQLLGDRPEHSVASTAAPQA